MERLDDIWTNNKFLVVRWSLKLKLPIKIYSTMNHLSNILSYLNICIKCPCSLNWIHGDIISNMVQSQIFNIQINYKKKLLCTQCQCAVQLSISQRNGTNFQCSICYTVIHIEMHSLYTFRYIEITSLLEHTFIHIQNVQTQYKNALKLLL